MKVSVSTIVLCVTLAGSVLAAAPVAETVKTPNLNPPVLVIDQFSSGGISKSDTWWKFDRLAITDVTDKETKDKYIMIGGKAQNWYVGGMGTYIAKDAAGAKALSIKVLGTGKNSGKIKMELVDDDAGSPDVEQDDKFIPIKDDKFTTKEININWTGWKTITIPVSDLILTNAGAGDGEWNPDTLNDRYGLMTVQIIVVASSASGEVNFGMKDLELIK